MENRKDTFSTEEAGTDARRRWGRRLLLSTGLAALGALVWLVVKTPVENWLQGGRMLSDWAYVSAETRAELSEETDWQASSWWDPVQPSHGHAYLCLERVLPASSEERTLAFSYQNAQLAVSWEGRELFSTLDDSKILTGSQRTEVVLPPAKGDGRLRIEIYSPLRLRFSAGLWQAADLPVRETGMVAAKIVFAALALLLGAILLGFGIRFHRHPWRRQLLTAGWLGGGIAGGLCLDLAIPGLSFASPVFFRLQLLCLVVVSVATLFCMTGRKPWTPWMEVLLGGALLLGLFLTVCPFEPLVILLIKGYGVWHMASTAVVLLGQYRHRRLVLPAPLYVLTLVLLLWEGACWLDALFQFSSGFPWLLPIGGVCLLAVLLAMSVGGLAQENKATKATEHQTPPAGEAGVLRFTGIAAEETVLRALTALVIEKCDTDSHHVLHVAEYVRVLCLHSGMSAEEAEQIARASLLHDVGKIVIPHTVLFKEQQLTAEEFEQIQCHALYGYHMLSGADSPFLQLAADIARQHHEHYDGSGYLGLRGREICKAASLTAVADVFDALTTDRSYKKAWGFDEGFAYILSHSGDYFDPEAVQAFANARPEIETIYGAIHGSQHGDPKTNGEEETAWRF